MDRLSNEILEHIMTYLGHTDIDSCRFTCRRFNAVIHSSVLLRYLYRLNIAGRIDSELHSPNLSVSRHLSMLQDFEAAWLRADFTPVSTLRLPKGITHVMSIYGSLYALKNLIGHDFSYSKIMRIDEASLASPDASWQELDLTPPGGAIDRAVRDIHIVGDCNLLVTVSVEGVGDRVHQLIFDFYTADTFEPHPDAIRSSMILHCPSSLRPIIPGGNIFSYVAAMVAVSGDFVLFQVTNWESGGVNSEGEWEKDNIYYCISWREGMLVPLGTRSHAGSAELQFITKDMVMLTGADEGHRLEFCMLARCPERGYVLQTLLYLQLPELAPSVTQATSSSIYVDDTGSTGMAAGPIKSPPLFSTSMGSSMFAVSMTLRLEQEMDEDRYRTFILVMRCASLFDLTNGVSPEGRLTWPQPVKSYLYMDGEPPQPTDTQSATTSLTDTSVRTMDVEEWSREGVLWLDCDDEVDTRGRYIWCIYGQRLLGWSDDLEHSELALPLRMYHFNQYDIKRARALTQSGHRQAGTTAEEQSGSHEDGPDVEVDIQPSDSSFHWTDLPNGRKIAVVDQPFFTPAGDWWGHDLVSNLPFAITQTTRAEHWPMLMIHGDLLLRQQHARTADVIENGAERSGTCFEMLRIGSGWTSE